MTASPLYPVFICIVIALVLTGLSYCAGLTTGRQAKLDNTAEQERNKEIIGTLRQQVGTQHNLINGWKDSYADLSAHCRLLRLRAINPDDARTLIRAAEKLELAAATFSAIKAAKGHVKDCEMLQQQLRALATNSGAEGDQPHPDTLLIEWLDQEATYNAEFESAELRFPIVSPFEGVEHIRDALLLARQQHRERDLEDMAEGQGFGLVTGEAA